VAASGAYTWRDSTPGYKITKRGPEALAKTFSAAIQDKAAKGENYASFSYSSNSPQKIPSEKYDTRFAGDVLIGGINGEFGSVTNDRNNPNQENLALWANQFSSGPFSPFGSPADGALPPPPAKEQTA